MLKNNFLQNCQPQSFFFKLLYPIQKALLELNYYPLIKVVITAYEPFIKGASESGTTISFKNNKSVSFSLVSIF